MATRKKLGFGLLLAVVSLLFFGFILHKNALAALQTDQDVKDMRFAFQDARTIIGTDKDDREYRFIDSDHTDGNAEYVLNGSGSGFNVTAGELCAGKIKLRNTTPSNITNQQGQIAADFSNFSFSRGGVACDQVAPFQKAQLGNPTLVYAWFVWVDRDTIQSVDGRTTYKRGTGSNNDVFSVGGAQADAECRSQIVLSTNRIARSFSTNVATGLITDPGRVIEATGISSDRMPGSCRIFAINEQSFTDHDEARALASRTIFIGLLANADKDPSADAGGAGAASNSCEGNNNFGLEWLLCGIIAQVDQMVEWMNGAVQDQLDFNVKQNLEDPAGIKRAWSAIKNIATAVLVVLMLVMVISQALGGGPFDAYTIRKLLPRLLVAVILMQISWDLCIWLIRLANDAGNGIRDLLAAPFGGWGNLRLQDLLGGLGDAAPGATLLTGLTVGTLAVVINPFSVVLLGFVILMAVFTALATLLFRVILIIAAVIFAPLALAAWILPGTEKYFKQWWTNFFKALMLFPLIVSIIVIGRIFAWIISSGGAGTVGPFDLFAVLVGYFGPYFLLPKVFKWSGGLLGAAAGIIASNALTKAIREKGGAEIKGYGERYQGKFGKRYSPNDPSRFRRGFHRLQSGSFLPTERSRRLTIAKGDKWASERSDEARALEGRAYEKALANGYTDGTGKKWGKGVGAAKQALLDMAGNDDTDPDRRAAQETIQHFLDTNSWIELQHSKITKGKHAGKYLWETPMWEATLAQKPELYSKTLANRPELSPHLLQYTYSTDKVADYLHPEEFAGIDKSDTEAREAKATEILSRKGAKRGERLSNADRHIMAISDQMSPDAFSGVAQGFYQQIQKLRQEGLTDEEISAGQVNSDGARVSKALQARLDAIASTGLPGQTILSKLASGSVKGDLDVALGGDGEGGKVDLLLQKASRTGSTGTQTSRPPAPAAPGVAVAGAAAPSAAAGPTTAGPRPTTTGGIPAATRPREGAFNLPGESTATESGLSANAISEAVAKGVRQANRETLGDTSATFTPPVTKVDLPSGGTLEIPHEPGETISPGGVILPSGTRPETGGTTMPPPPPEEPPTNP